MDSASRLVDLREDFRAASTQSMPIAGMVFWVVIAAASLILKPVQMGYLVGFGSGMIFPLGLLIDRLTGRKVKPGSSGNPVLQLFLQSMGLVALVWPLVILGASIAHDANLIVLGGAILMGIIWIPY